MGINTAKLIKVREINLVADPDVALAYSVNEEREIEIFIGGISIKAKLEPAVVVTNNAAVAGVGQGIVACKNGTIVI
ncbi:hypothetical protein D3C85_1141290 [compost metagenome]